MATNEALFAQNGRCGYVLKPEFMRRGAKKESEEGEKEEEKGEKEEESIQEKEDGDGKDKNTQTTWTSGAGDGALEARGKKRSISAKSPSVFASPLKSSCSLSSTTAGEDEEKASSSFSSSLASLSLLGPLLRIKITILSGQTIPKAGHQGDGGEVVDPFVVTKIHGLPPDKQKQATRAVKKNGKKRQR